MDGGQLPSPREGLRASVVDDVLFVTGGQDARENDLTSILSWDPVAESWEAAGTLLWGDTTMQLSPFQLHLLDANFEKSIQNIKHHWKF